MRFSYCRASLVHSDSVDFRALERAAEEIHWFCQSDEPLIPMPRTQRVEINSECVAIPTYPLLGGGHTYRLPDGDADLTISVDVRGGGGVLEFPADYRNRRMNVTGNAGFGWTEAAFVLAGALALDSVTLDETAAYDACEMGDALRIGDEFILVEAKETSPNQLRLVRGAGGTSPAAHDAGDAAAFMVGPHQLRDVAAKIAQVIISRRDAPSRGVSRPQVIQSEERVVTLDWLAQVRDELLPFQALPGVA